MLAWIAGNWPALLAGAGGAGLLGQKLWVWTDAVQGDEPGNALHWCQGCDKLVPRTGMAWDDDVRWRCAGCRPVAAGGLAVQDDSREAYKRRVREERDRFLREGIAIKAEPIIRTEAARRGIDLACCAKCDCWYPADQFCKRCLDRPNACCTLPPAAPGDHYECLACGNDWLARAAGDLDIRWVRASGQYKPSLAQQADLAIKAGVPMQALLRRTGET